MERVISSDRILMVVHWSIMWQIMHISINTCKTSFAMLSDCIPFRMMNNVVAVSLDAIRTVLALSTRKSSLEYNNLLESVPFSSNYLIEQSFLQGKKIIEPLAGHRRSCIKIREHIGLPNIVSYCELGLSEEQINWLKDLDSQHIIIFP